MKTILILYSELMPYNIVVIKELLRMDCTAHIVRWTKCKTPYIPPELPNVVYYDRNSFSDPSSLLNQVRNIKPDLIWVSGWIDKLYCKVVGSYRKECNIPIVAGCDTQWQGGKQWLNVLFSPLRHKRWFSHIQIAGIWQYEYARRLGFKRSQIIEPFYSADTNIFQKVSISSKEISYPRRLLFIGRFAKVKGLSFLLNAWKSIPDRKDWVLTLIGNGPLRDTLDGFPDVEIKDFMSQEELAVEMQNSGAFILPSVFEPWALVLHEAAAGGLPILSSNCCGAVPYFVLENYNGHLFTPGDVSSIRKALQSLINSSDEELIRMSYKSRELSRRINPEIVAQTLLSII
ncbi:glycosyltransferase family 4 protein [Parabacteroides acidifaciens]|uniref:Glycosyltransferase n=1 Tax=Parabacteroides acidifaciens TaxID=2290935 RepID=A0A3D8HGB2_9BACT|nr:glycosyltransferase family 4 protein [Parabacteroides acidifaciens]MBC8601297.1 glycosyltransferase family 4 protein [Parabacteroides acidifaciens]RDU49978.1 glycosyltransferase [Parabacteroides acidifaciens]